VEADVRSKNSRYLLIPDNKYNWQLPITVHISPALRGGPPRDVIISDHLHRSFCQTISGSLDRFHLTEISILIYNKSSPLLYKFPSEFVWQLILEAACFFAGIYSRLQDLSDQASGVTF
jgi:hypothetical protein